MSDDTEISSAADSIQESLNSTVDADEIESMLEEKSVESVGRELGSRIGREVGSRIGGALGPAVVRDIKERKSLREILGNAVKRLFRIVVELLRSPDLKSGVSKLVDAGRDLPLKGSVSDSLGAVLPGSDTESEEAEPEEPEAEEETEEEETEEEETEEDEPGGDEEAAEEEPEEGESEASEESAEAESDDVLPSGADLSADQLKDLREDTYREILETMSYRDLQSLAKDVGVKANLAQDEMTDQIVEAFSEGDKA